MRLLSFSKLVLRVQTLRSLFYWEPHLFPPCIEKLHLDEVVESHPGPQQSRCEARHCSDIFEKSIQAMSNLKELSLYNELVPKSLVVISLLPLQKLSLNQIVISQSGLLALSNAIKRSANLRSLKISLNVIEHDAPDTSLLFSAILSNSRIRNFSFISLARPLKKVELLSLAKLVESSNTLRDLSLAHSIQPAYISLILNAFSKNRSLIKAYLSDDQFFTASSSIQQPNPIELVLINDSLLKILRENRTLKCLKIALRAFKDDHILDRTLLDETLKNRSNITSFHLGGITYENTKFTSQGDLFLQSQAANVLKIGRLLSGSSLVLGRRLPVELIDYILKQASSESPMHDQDWRVIRRVVMNRGTIGRLLMNDEPFDAYELLYRCRSLA